MFTNWSIVILKYYLLLGLNPGVDLTRTYLGAELVELKKQVHAAICAKYVNISFEMKQTALNSMIQVSKKRN